MEDLVVDSVSSTEISVSWDLPTRLCPAEVFRVEYQAINVDQCDSEESSIRNSWQTEISATLTGLKAYTTYRVTVTPGFIGESGVIKEGDPLEIGDINTGEEGRRALSSYGYLVIRLIGVIQLHPSVYEIFDHYITLKS